jgi:hypothetical protein
MMVNINSIRALMYNGLLRRSFAMVAFAAITYLIYYELKPIGASYLDVVGGFFLFGIVGKYIQELLDYIGKLAKNFKYVGERYVK